MKPAPFDYCCPETLQEALNLLSEFDEDALVLAGGLSLGALLNMRMVRPKVIIDINYLEALAKIEVTKDSVRIGSLARQADVLHSSDCQSTLPLLTSALQHVGHYQTRSRGTLGGSVAHADPSAETPLCLATLGGQVELSSVRGVRKLEAEKFFQGVLTTARRSDEMLTALIWPILPLEAGNAFDEISERRGDFAIVAAAAWAEKFSWGIRFALGLGGIEDRPVVLSDSIDGIVGNSVNHAVDAFMQGLRSYDDKRASSDYRKHLARYLGKRTLLQALERAL